MKYVSYTLVDDATQIPVSLEPARKGPVMPMNVEHIFSLEESFVTGIPQFYGRVVNSEEPYSWMKSLSECQLIDTFKQELNQRSSKKRKQFTDSTSIQWEDVVLSSEDCIALKSLISDMTLDKSMIEVKFRVGGCWKELNLKQIKALVKKFNRTIQNTYTSFYNFDKEIDSCSTIEDCLSIQSKLNNFNME